MRLFNFNMPVQLHDRLFAEKDRTGLSVAEITRRALDDYLEERERRSGVPEVHHVRGVAGEAR